MLTRLSLHLKAAKMLALRELLERSLFTNDRALFGAKLQRSYSGNPEPQLLDQNRKNVSYLLKTIPPPSLLFDTKTSSIQFFFIPHFFSSVLLIQS